MLSKQVIEQHARRLREGLSPLPHPLSCGIDRIFEFMRELEAFRGGVVKEGVEVEEIALEWEEEKESVTGLPTTERTV